MGRARVILPDDSNAGVGERLLAGSASPCVPHAMLQHSRDIAWKRHYASTFSTSGTQVTASPSEVSNAGSAQLSCSMKNTRS